MIFEPAHWVRYATPVSEKGRQSFWLWVLVALFAALPGQAFADLTCQSEWYKARLTHYESYPVPGSTECVRYNGCASAGRFYGVNGKKSEAWVAQHNIVSVHQKHWRQLGMKILRMRQGSREIWGQVLDICADADCRGCCTANLGGDGYLIDLESYTARRFGARDGIVEFQICQ